MICGAAIASDSTGFGEIKETKDYEDAFAGHDFTFISFSTDEEEAKKVDDLMEDVKIYVDKQIEKSDWHARSIGWFRANTTEHPELSEGSKPFSNQMIFSNQLYTHRYLDFHILEGESREDSVEHLALMIRSLTGDWYPEMTCDELQAEDRLFYDELIYLGEADDLVEGSFADTMNWVAMNEKYTVTSNQAGFGYVTDPACRE